MRTKYKLSFIVSVIISLTLITSLPAHAVDYAKPVALNKGAQAGLDQIKQKESKTLRVAYMPPATEFNYYIAIGEGIKDLAKKTGVDTFMLAPQSGADINGQMGMLQDVISQQVDAIIISTHDENAAAPLLKRAVNQGIVIAIVNSDIPNFPTPVHAVVGYSQRKGTYKIGQYALKKAQGKALKVGVIEGQPGYHSTERCGGFLDAIKGSNFEVVTSLDGKWNVEGGNAAGMDALQAHPEIELIFAANDYMIMGTAVAAKALGRDNLMLLGNDGGFFVSYDRGGSWMHYNNIPAGEFYDISVDNQDPYLIYGGTQDDSSVLGPSREWRRKYPDGWKYIWLDAWSGGDGCYNIPDPEDPNTVYFSSQNGAIRRKDMQADRSVGIRPRFR